jgi:hypothetical protein
MNDRKSLDARTPAQLRRELQTAFDAGSTFAEAYDALRIADRQRKLAATLWAAILDGK